MLYGNAFVQYIHLYPYNATNQWASLALISLAALVFYYFPWIVNNLPVYNSKTHTPSDLCHGDTDSRTITNLNDI